jgi:2-dehydro-3-deoxyphosphogluconate aldolase/(4S)-4-hydroxy-2-oxoglutarate aldolase
MLGMGTVRSEQLVHDSIDVGATFLLSQVFRPELVEAARSLGVPFVPYVLTPNEILAAWEAGVPAVKVSPIRPGRRARLPGRVRPPLPDIPMLPTGGVRLDEVSVTSAGARTPSGSAATCCATRSRVATLDALAGRAREAVESLSAPMPATPTSSTGGEPSP